ncbi:MAG: hypothetical protein P8J37_04190 [Fuerstiella sp.]|nr:hypothetical protein [Fuerstiella sp.]
MASQLDWGDVVSLQVATCGAIDVTDSKNTKIRIHADLHGQRHFLSQLRKFREGDLIQDNLLDLAELE